MKKAKSKSKKYIRTLRPLRSQSESAKRPLVSLKVKSKKDKRIKYYYFVLLSFGPDLGDPKAIKEDQLISFLHTLVDDHQAAPRRFSLALEEEEQFLVYALAWMSLARASTLVLLINPKLGFHHLCSS